MSSINERLAAIEKALTPPVVEDWDWMMYTTTGELDSQLAAGAMPVMPAHCDIKPDIGSAADKASKATKPDVRNRQRPQ
jgi:hypothetical protein